MKTVLNLQEAARLIATAGGDVRDWEVKLIDAIEHGRLHANIKRWATEQCDGEELPGNINPRETCVERAALDAWLRGRGAAG